MLSLFKYFKARKAEKIRRQKWEQEKPRIAQLQAGLSQLGGFPQSDTEAFQFAVNFFNVVSEFQDSGGIYNAPQGLKETQEKLNGHLGQAGRCQFGINRTTRGQTVTLDNTYWGDIFGVFTHTGRHWRNSDSTYPDFAQRFLKDPASMPGVIATRRVITEFQVKPFIMSHLPKMIQFCDQLLAA